MSDSAAPAAQPTRSGFKSWLKEHWIDIVVVGGLLFVFNQLWNLNTTVATLNGSVQPMVTRVDNHQTSIDAQQALNLDISTRLGRIETSLQELKDEQSATTEQLTALADSDKAFLASIAKLEELEPGLQMVVQHSATNRDRLTAISTSLATLEERTSGFAKLSERVVAIETRLERLTEIERKLDELDRRVLQAQIGTPIRLAVVARQLMGREFLVQLFDAESNLLLRWTAQIDPAKREHWEAVMTGIARLGDPSALSFAELVATADMLNLLQPPEDTWLKCSFAFHRAPQTLREELTRELGVEPQELPLESSRRFADWTTLMELLQSLPL